MPQNNRPTKEELKAQEEEAIKLAEELENNPPEEEAPEDIEARAKAEAEEEAPEEKEEEPILTDEEVQELEEKVAEEEEKEEEEAEPSKEYYKRRFKESSQGANKELAKTRVINQALAEAEDVPEPTEEELQKEYQDWDVMSDIEKTFAKETIISKRWRETISKAKDQATKIEKWNDSVDEYTEDPKTLNTFPQLEGKTDDFKDFAKLQENNNVPFNVLIPAFLFQESTTNKPHKGKMFERSGGGDKKKPELNDGSISLEEGRRLRETNYDKWKEMLRDGKIKSDF